MATLKEGDKVLVTRTAKDYERGWNNSWVKSMNKYVGQIGVVTYVEGKGNNADITLDFGEIPVHKASGDGTFGFPAFVLEKQTEALKVLKIKRSTQKTGLKIYGKILGDPDKKTGEQKTYNFAYIRRQNFRGWICSCENFFFSMFKKGRNCKHLHQVREQYGRYGQKVA